MEDIFEQRAMKLTWNKVCNIISEEIEDILGLHIQCKINRVEDSFWSVTFIGYRLPLSKLCQIIHITQPTPEDWEDAMPDDGGVDVNGIGMALCEKLVARQLQLTWEHHLITEDNLWLVGVAKGTTSEIQQGLSSGDKMPVQFTDEQLVEVYRCIHETLDSGYPITAERKALLKDVCAQIQRRVPDLANRVMRSNEKELAAQRRPVFDGERPERIEIYWQDLTPAKQHEILQVFGENGNWDVFPIATIDVPTESETEL